VRAGALNDSRYPTILVPKLLFGNARPRNSVSRTPQAELGRPSVPKPELGNKVPRPSVETDVTC